MLGRRITKSVEQRREEFLVACRRSGFTGLELVQILVNWNGWRSIIVRVTDAHMQSVTNSDYDEHDQVN